MGVLQPYRRSFGTLSEWVEFPVGVVPQIQGHKPSATAEKQYCRRPLDLLCMWHAKKLKARFWSRPLSSSPVRVVKA